MLDNLKEMIKKIMPDVDVSNVDNNTKLVEDLGFDSLAIMMLAINIENEYNIHFEQQVDFVTVGDVISYIESVKK